MPCTTTPYRGVYAACDSVEIQGILPLVAVVFPDASSAYSAAERVAEYLVAPQTLVLVPPDARFTLRRNGSLLILFQRTPSADPDPAAAKALQAVLDSLGEGIPLPR